MRFRREFRFSRLILPVLVSAVLVFPPVARGADTATTEPVANAATVETVQKPTITEPEATTTTTEPVANAATVETVTPSSAVPQPSTLALVKLMANPPAMITEAATANPAIAAAIERGGTFSQNISLMAVKVAPAQVDLAKLVVIFGADDEQTQSLVASNPGLIQAIGSLRGPGD